MEMTRNEAVKIAPALVAYTESNHNSVLWRKLDASKRNIRKGQTVIVAKMDYETGEVQYIQAKVTSVSPGFDGPMVRVAANGCSWRVDGNHEYQPVSR